MFSWEMNQVRNRAGTEMNAFMHFVIVIKQFCVCGYDTEYRSIHFFSLWHKPFVICYW